ncbi:hypothetical protein TWF730_000449 [Orbilia blumenaviensis]|uniref:Uncharacterized protein n=1 Tax=Orbilia blumenaviensis TaxID=1796055 RepID=A0AAV9VNQ2_9PEZI
MPSKPFQPRGLLREYPGPTAIGQYDTNSPPQWGSFYRSTVPMDTELPPDSVREPQMETQDDRFGKLFKILDGILERKLEGKNFETLKPLSTLRKPEKEVSTDKKDFINRHEPFSGRINCLGKDIKKLDEETRELIEKSRRLDEETARLRSRLRDMERRQEVAREIGNLIARGCRNYCPITYRGAWGENSQSQTVESSVSGIRDLAPCFDRNPKMGDPSSCTSLKTATARDAVALTRSSSLRSTGPTNPSNSSRVRRKSDYARPPLLKTIETRSSASQGNWGYLAYLLLKPEFSQERAEYSRIFEQIALESVEVAGERG